MSIDDVPLLPKPRSIEITGAPVPLENLTVQEQVDSSAVNESGDEAYTLRVFPQGIDLIARTEEGLRWGRATLDQLRRLKEVPALVIQDAPLFARRGVMLDISRDRVPTMQSLFELVDQLSALKMNHLQLYVEHTLAYQGHEDVWMSASPLTLEELSTLDAYASEKGVSLNANQNCLGHFERWLKHPRYAPLAECAEGCLVREGWYVRPNTLCPLDTRVPELLDDLLRQQVPRCSGDFVNIGCDEPWDLGKGRSRDACAEQGKGLVFSRHVSRVAETVRQLGKTPQYWCDPEPNEDDGLPRELTALIWGYEEQSDLITRAAAHRGAGREIWVAPGTSCWGSCTGRSWNRRGNLDHAVSVPEASGFLCTAWGDGGHRQPWPVTLAGFADAAMAAWSGAGTYDDAAMGLHVFGQEELGPWLIRLGGVDRELCRGERPGWRRGEFVEGTRLYNRNAMWQELETPLFKPEGPGDTAAWEEVAERLTELEKSLPREVPDDRVAGECTFAVDLSRWIADRAIIRRTNPNPEPRHELAARMSGLIEEHRRQWLARSRYGGLEDSTAHFLRHVTGG